MADETEMNQESLVCPKCSKVYSLVSTKHFHQHVRTCGNGAFTCETCGKHFAGIQTLKRHLNMHVNPEPFSCPVCKRGFQTKFACNEHKKTHIDLSDRVQDRIKCDRCDKTFQWKSSLRRHLETHQLKGTYKCPCGSEFPKYASLRYHKMKCDVFKRSTKEVTSSTNSELGNADIEKEASSIIHRCQFCKKGFRNRKLFEQHTDFCDTVFPIQIFSNESNAVVEDVNDKEMDDTNGTIDLNTDTGTVIRKVEFMKRTDDSSIKLSEKNTKPYTSKRTIGKERTETRKLMKTIDDSHAELTETVDVYQGENTEKDKTNKVGINIRVVNNIQDDERVSKKKIKRSQDRVNRDDGDIPEEKTEDELPEVGVQVTRSGRKVHKKTFPGFAGEFDNKTEKVEDVNKVTKRVDNRNVQNLKNTGKYGARKRNKADKRIEGNNDDIKMASKRNKGKPAGNLVSSLLDKKNVSVKITDKDKRRSKRNSDSITYSRGNNDIQNLIEARQEIDNVDVVDEMEDEFDDDIEDMDYKAENEELEDMVGSDNDFDELDPDKNEVHDKSDLVVKRHKSNLMLKVGFRCTNKDCAEMVTGLNKLKQHKLKKHKEKLKYICAHCYRSYTSRFTLQEHTAMSHYKMEFSPLVLHGAEIVDDDMEVHMCTKCKFMCQGCSKKRPICQHSHTCFPVALKYFCPYCEKDKSEELFGTYEACQQHIQTDHAGVVDNSADRFYKYVKLKSAEVDPASSVEEEDRECMVCRLVLGTSDELRAHLNDKHGKLHQVFPLFV